MFILVVASALRGMPWAPLTGAMFALAAAVLLLAAILTGSDSTNVAMLGLNDSLGYRPVATERAYLKD